MSTSTSPWLSVILPTYNGEKYLSQSLDSIVAQQDAPIEVIAVDDGSSDSTCAILDGYSAKLKLKIIKGERRGNWVLGTNAGIAQAQGEYVCFLHQDDLWLPGRISKLLALSKEFPQAVALLHQSFFIGPSGERLGRWSCPFSPQKSLLDSGKIFSRLLVQNFIAIPAPMFKRETLSTVGPLDEKLWFTADWKLWLQLARAGSWAYLPEALACFRLHPEAQTVTGARNIESFREQYDRILTEFLPQPGDDSGIAALAHFSSDANQFLAARFHRQKPALLPLLKRGFLLGPIGWYRFMHYSRIVERVLARMKVQLHGGAAAEGGEGAS